MAKPIPMVWDELLSILRKIEAAMAWRRFEQVERPGGITPMGAMSDDALEDLDTLIGQFMFLHVETVSRLRNPRLCGFTEEECNVWRTRLERIKQHFSWLLYVCPSRASV